MMGQTTFRRPSFQLKSKEELSLMRIAGLLAGETLLEVKKAIRPGVTTKELSLMAERYIRKNGGVPTFIGYRGYPDALCVSINEQVVHGIPGPRQIEAGDVVSIDVAATVKGFVGDTATTVIVGDAPSKEAESLVSVTEGALFAAIDQMIVGNRLGDVSSAVEDFVKPSGFGVVRDFVGHGIGRQMHEEPAVPNYGSKGTGIKLQPGLVLAIEPMITVGGWQVDMLSDGWTVVTRDGSLAAHFEHTVAITEEGPKILTSVEC